MLSGGQGGQGKTFAVLAPVACPGDSISAALPAFDATAAGAALDAAGWALGADGTRAKDGQPLSVTFLHDTSAGAAGQAAAELATQQWTALGVSVVDKAQTGAATNETLFATGDWDIAWVPLNVSSPDQLVPFLSGPAPAEGGVNFAGIANDDYSAGVTAAAALPGTEGCPTWFEAESALVAAADVVPFANSVVQDLRQGRRVRHLRLAHPDQHPPRRRPIERHRPGRGRWTDEALPDLARRHGVPGAAVGVLATARSSMRHGRC